MSTKPQQARRPALSVTATAALLLSLAPAGAHAQGQGTKAAASPASTPSASAASAPATVAAPKAAAIASPVMSGAGGSTVRKVGSVPKSAYAPIPVGPDQAEVGEIDMFVGESRVFPAPGVARIAVGNGKLLTASALDEKEIILFANGEGTSSLFVWHADGRYQRVKINIVQGDTTRTAREVAAFLARIPNTRASVVGANIIVEGEQLSDFDREKVDLLAQRYPQIINFTHKQSWEKMVAMDVKVVEFPSTLLRDMGLKWNSTGGMAMGAIWTPFSKLTGPSYGINISTGQGNAPPIYSTSGELILPTTMNVLSAVNMGLNAQLNLLAQQGRATLLAEPQLSARSGSRASFTAGGEIPYAVSTRDGVYVQFKTYGVKLEIEPRVDAQGNVRASIMSEVSSIDRSVTTQAGPALLTRKAQTEFNVRAGETIVLAGLLQRELSDNVDKVPGLGDLPILGALFRSKSFQNKETELVVFVTPTVVSAASPGNTDRIQQTTSRLEERLGAKPYLSDPLQPGVAYEQPDQVPRVKPEEAAPTPDLPALPEGVGRSADGALLRIKTGKAALRAQPRSDAETLLMLDQGATVVLGSQDAQSEGAGRWLNVQLGSLRGWVSAESLTPWRPGDAEAPPARAAAKADAAPKPLLLGRVDDELLGAPMRVTGEAQALRQAPQAQAGIVTRLTKGEMVRALKLAPQGAWVAVQVRSGSAAMRGWLPAQWLVPMNTP
ncbi:MAG TPA: pilus assembly protein N-terminal domain-containing protein [Burkholderiaceae bacterium]|nr:pilus assembly protein N-terminal domain-containing protein [Burkholderiaceae bacterium]